MPSASIPPIGAFYPPTFNLRRLEDKLLALCLTRFLPMPMALLYLHNHCLQRTAAAISRKRFDKPLQQLADEAAEELSRQKALSPLSVQAYMDVARFQLQRTCGAYFAALRLACPPGLDPALPLGETRLRDHLPRRAGAVKRAVAVMQRRLRRACSAATWEAVFTIFWTARWVDVCDYFYRRLHSFQAAEDATQDTAAALWRKLPRYDPQRASLIAFVFMVGWDILKKYRAAQARDQILLPLEEVAKSPWAAKHFATGLFPLDLYDRLDGPVSRQLLQVVLSLERLPHQILAWILCKALDQAPREILKKYSRLQLRTLALIAEALYLAKDPSGRQAVRPLFQRLRAQMDEPLEELLRREEDKRRFAAVSADPVGDIEFGRYLWRGAGGPSAAQLSNDWHSIKKSLALELRLQPSGPVREWVRQDATGRAVPKKSRKQPKRAARAKRPTSCPKAPRRWPRPGKGG